MSLLAIFHEELHENFKFYASVFNPFYRRKENEFIPLQGFFHFAKLMNLAQSSEELMGFFTESLHEIDGMNVPVDDTLNIRGGMNYAQFLSALLRIAYIKKDQSGDTSNQAYKNALDLMFQNSSIDIQKRQIHDPDLQTVYEHSVLQKFLIYEEPLCALFSAKAVKLGDTYLQMHKQEFINILGEIGLLIYPKEKSPEEEKKIKEVREKQATGQQITPEQAAMIQETSNVFGDQEVAQVIGTVSSFDPEYLDYYNFLECVVRVAKARPWNEEEVAEMPSFDTKLEKILNSFEEKFHNEVTPIFENQRETFERERRYQPRVVVDDDEAMGSDDEDMQ